MILRKAAMPAVTWVQRRGLFFPWGHPSEESLRKEQSRRDRQVLQSAPSLPVQALKPPGSSSLKDQILLQKENISSLPALSPAAQKALMTGKEEIYASYKRKFLPSRIDDELTVFQDPDSGPFIERTHAEWTRKLWKYPFPSFTNYDYYVQEERKKQYTKLVEVQLLDEKRLISLGSDLAAAWFLLSRNCRIKFKDQEDWLDSTSAISLPTKFVPDYYLEAIEASTSLLLYEGLQNLRNLQFLKYVDVSYCEMVDEWFLDRMAGEYRETLEHLDISGCYRLDWNGIEAIARFKNLKVLILRDLDHIQDLKLLCLLLLEVNPDLDIRGVDYIDIELLKEGGHHDLLEDLEKELLFIQGPKEKEMS